MKTRVASICRWRLQGRPAVGAGKGMVSEPLMQQAHEPHLADAAREGTTLQPTSQPLAGYTPTEAAQMSEALPELLQQAGPSHSLDHPLGKLWHRDSSD